MKPFLLLAIRAEDAAADNEYGSFLACTGLGVLPAAFDAFTGHKEAVSALPRHAVLLATSPSCPVQAFRVGCNVYATQFHPELDAAGLCTRIDAYKHAGYFEPGQADALKAQALRSNVTCPPAILHQFVRRYAAPGARAVGSLPHRGYAHLIFAARDQRLGLRRAPARSCRRCARPAWWIAPDRPSPAARGRSDRGPASALA